MDAIVTIDEAGFVVVFNHVAERMFRCQAVDAIGRPGRRFLSEDLFGEMGHRLWVTKFRFRPRADVPT
jgi:two-component system sensor kinase